MKVYDGTDLRNVALVGHLHSGKTTLTAAMLFTAGATSRLTRVDEGNAPTDFDEEEVARKISISAAIAPVEWKKNKVNLVDTPGFNSFLYETKAALVGADSGVVLIDGVAGVEVGTEHVYNLCAELNIPRAFLINKLDRERSSFERALASVEAAFGRGAIPVQIPIGSERDFKGVIDLIRMRAWVYANDGDGKGKEQDIPADLADIATVAHEALVEIVAEGNDALLEEFFAEGTLPVEHIVDGLRQAVRDRRLFPVLCCSALHNIGTGQLLDQFVELLPNPVERDNAYGSWNGQQVIRKMNDTDPLSVYVFKTIADPFAGRLSYFRVISGVLKNDAHLINATTATDERFAHIACPLGKTLLPGHRTARRRYRRGGEAEGHPHRPHAARQSRPRPVSARPTAGALHRLRDFGQEPQRRRPAGPAIHRILEEDLCLRFYRDPQTKDFLLAGTGQQHVETCVSRLKRVTAWTSRCTRRRFRTGKPFAAWPTSRAGTRSRPAATASSATAGSAWSR